MNRVAFHQKENTLPVQEMWLIFTGIILICMGKVFYFYW